MRYVSVLRGGSVCAKDMLWALATQAGTMKSERIAPKVLKKLFLRTHFLSRLLLDRISDQLMPLSSLLALVGLLLFTVLGCETFFGGFTFRCKVLDEVRAGAGLDFRS